MNKLLIICGPTATGKTKLGIELAKKFNGEIISADSRQIYKFMNIGTGKDISNCKFQISNSFQIINFKFQIGYYEIDGVKLWLTDLVEPDYRFNVADYKKCADLVINDILSRGKLPIVVGGTGFYIKALTEDIETIGVEPDWELRKRLSAKDIKILSTELQKLDEDRWERMNESDRKNPRRLIRAIEIATWKLEKGSSFSSRYPASHFQLLTSIFFIGLTAPNEILYQRIDQRVEERMKEGIEKEIKMLLEKGYNWENSALGTTIAYKEWKKFFGAGVGAQHVAPTKNEIKKQVIQKWKFDEHDYARRQFTWFKKDKRINWFDITKNNWQEEVEKKVESWYI